ncbi:unnamed protein product [Vicia faba]|uniref:Uncharacterized protein n=1 Tax=Vicia faba TaxID=3906 RepID=A0AAV0YWL2_VICFA|nr:unnamed protein product [Vicia faba]
MFGSGGMGGNQRDSVWWKDLLKLDWLDGVEQSVFANNILCRFLEGNNIYFWHNKWMGYQMLKEAFPELFAITAYPNFYMVDACFWEESVWKLKEVSNQRSQDDVAAHQEEDVLFLLSVFKPSKSAEDQFW